MDALAQRDTAQEIAGGMETAIALLDETDDLGVVREVLAKADAWKSLLKTIGESAEKQNACAELKLRAARRAGELLLAMREPAKGKPNGRLVLPEGLTRDIASRYRRLARVDEARLEEYLSACQRLGEEVTLNGALRFAPPVPGSRGFAYSSETRDKAAELRGLGWTQQQIATFLQVSPSTVAYWLDPNTREKMLERKRKREAQRRRKRIAQRAKKLRESGDPLGEVYPHLRRALEQLQVAVDAAEGPEKDRREGLFPLLHGVEDALSAVMQGRSVRVRGTS